MSPVRPVVVPVVNTLGYKPEDIISNPLFIVLLVFVFIFIIFVSKDLK